MPRGFRAFNIEKDEQYSVTILLIQSIFLGIFAGAFDVGAQSLFLEVFNASLVPKAFVISGIVGIIITSVYTRFQKRIRFSRFAVYNLVFVVIITSLLRLGFELTGDKRLVFATFVMMGPLTIISFLGFWGTVSRLFTLRQGKRLFGLIDTGQVIGIIVSSFAIPVLISFHFQVLNSLIICAASITLALILQLIIAREFKPDEKSTEERSTPERNTENSSFRDLFRSRYTRLMALFVALSVAVAFFIHFSFLTVLKDNYPDPATLASFLGAFMGALTIFTIIIKTFVYDKLMKTYGLRLALMLSPVLLIIFTFIASLIGSFYGYTATASGFAFFFLIIALSKLLAKSLKDSIEIPSSKILYQSLDVRIRYDVQARIDGTVNELSAFSSGLILSGLGLVSFVSLIHYSWFLIIILIMWFFVGYRLYKAYRNSLAMSLKKFQQSSADLTDSIPLMEKIISGNNREDLIMALKLAPQAWNGFISGNLNKLLYQDEEVKRLTLSLINDLNLFETRKDLENFQKKSSEEEKKLINDILEKFTISQDDIREERLKILLKSDRPEDRIKGLISIIRKNDPVFYPRVVSLFRDQDHSVRTCAIHTAGILNQREYVTYLVDLLDDPVFYSHAYNALCRMDDSILENLEHGFHKTGITTKALVRITRIMAHLSTPKAASCLINKLDHLNWKVSAEAIRGLTRINLPVNEFQSIKLFEALHRFAGIASWNLAAQYSIKEYQMDENLNEAMKEEISNSYDMIYGLLSVTYDPQALYHIRKNIESGTSEGITFAIELLDLFVQESAKGYLFPLLDDSIMTEKIRLLQTEFPVDMMKPHQLLQGIINRDYNQIRPYTRVCALEALEKMEDFKLTNDVVAQMFNPDPLLREISSGLVKKLDEQAYASVIRRLPEELRKSDETFLVHSDSACIQGENRKLEYLKRSGLFNEFQNNDILELARKFRVFRLDNGDTIMHDIIDKENILLIIQGEMKISTPRGIFKMEAGKLFRLSDFLISEEQLRFERSGDMLIMVLKESSIRELIFDDEDTFFKITGLFNKITFN